MLYNQVSQINTINKLLNKKSSQSDDIWKAIDVLFGPWIARDFKSDNGCDVFNTVYEDKVKLGGLLGRSDSLHISNGDSLSMECPELGPTCELNPCIQKDGKDNKYLLSNPELSTTAALLFQGNKIEKY